MRRRLMVVWLLLAAVVGGTPVFAAATSQGQARGATTVVASGLVNPRGFAFGPEGSLFVASGGSAERAAGVDRIEGGCPRRVLDGVPRSRVAFGAIVGVADVAVLDGRVYALVAGGDIDRGEFPNGLYRVGGDGAPELVADISAFIRDNPVAEKPGDYDTDGQPHAMVATPEGDGFFVTEGNSNQLLRVSLGGAVRRVADLSAGHPIPTGIAPAPGGGVYVGFLTSAPYPEGGARVVLIGSDGTSREVWRGLSLVTALAVDAAGDLYALEMATGYGGDPAAIAAGSGRVVRRTGPASGETVVDGLALPVAMEFGPDGGLYLAGPAFGADDGGGTILRVEPAGATPAAGGSALASAVACEGG